MRKYGVRALGLSLLAALGLMAFAAAAQAEDLTDGGKAGLFLVLLQPAAIGVGILALQLEPGNLLVAGRNLDILCMHSHINGTFKSDLDALVEGTFTGCLTFEHNEHNTPLPCFIPSKEIKGFALVLPKLHGGKLYVLFQEDGKAFALFTYEAGKGCPLPLHVEIKGSVAAEIEEDATPNKITFSQAIQLLLGDKLLYGTFSSYINGHGTATLTGGSAACKFGVI